MNTETTLTWLTPKLLGGGLTETVINYLTEKDRKITKDISWPEFFYIWSASRQEFEETIIFTEKFGTLVNKKNIHVLKTLAQENKEWGDLIREYLPIRYAVEVSENFAHLHSIMDRAKTKTEKLLVLNKIRYLLPVEKFDQERPIYYYQLSKGFPEHQNVALALIEVGISSGTISRYKIQNIVPFSENIVRGILNNGNENIDNLFRLYEKTGYEFILDAVKKKIEGLATGSHEVSYAIDEVRESLSRFRDKETKVLVKKPQLKYLDMVRLLIKKMNEDQLSKMLDHSSKLINLLPEYDASNDTLAEILAIVRKLMREFYKTTYKIYPDRFTSWYKYSKEETFVELCLLAISNGPDSGWWDMEEIVKAYELCGDERIITDAIKFILPKSDHLDRAINFLKWIKTNKSELWESASAALIKGNRVDDWFKKYNSKDHKENFNNLLGLLVA